MVMQRLVRIIAARLISCDSEDFTMYCSMGRLRPSAVCNGGAPATTVAADDTGADAVATAGGPEAAP
jgi:hypothetical protein